MALFTSAMPAYSGDNMQDIEALRSWACRLIGELRSFLYALDEQNVIKAREALKVAASGIEGVLSENQIPDIDISKVKGNRPYCIVEPGTDIDTGFWIAKDTDEGTALLAHVYYEEPESGLENGRFVIYSSGDIAIASEGVTRIVADGGVVTDTLTVNKTITAAGVDVINWLNVDNKPVTGNTVDEPEV